MGFFCQRNETDSEVRIELKTVPFYLLLAMIAAWMGINFILKSDQIGMFFFPILIGFMMIRFFSLVKVQKEVLVAMRDHRLKTQGSKFSFKNPFVYTIQKPMESTSSDA